MKAKAKLFQVVVVLALIFSTIYCRRLPQPLYAAPSAALGGDNSHDDGEGVIFFVADGMRQDLAETYADQGLMPTIAKLLRSGAKAADGGLLTQAPPNTGAGWYSLATGAWPGVHGSTNNTFDINGAPFGNRTGSFDTGVLQAETLAQAAERGGKKVAQIEWAGGAQRRDQWPNR